MRAVTASVPGKLILMGEHAVVYGRPALVAAVGLRAEVRATRGVDDGVLLDLPDVGYRATATWSQLLDHAARARDAWLRYADSPTRESFGAVLTGDPAHLVRVALGEVAGELGRDELPPLTLEVRSALPVGSGFGSSAAIAVGVVASCLALAGAAPDLATLDRLALEVERRQHGQPSGADHGTVLRGGVQAMRREAATGALRFEPVAVASAVLERFTVVHTGAPAESTGEVVAAVRDLRESDPDGFGRRLDRMESNVVSFARTLGEERPDWGRLRELIDDYESWLEGIGVVPGSVRQAIAEARLEGVSAKVSGAGGLSESGAGSLLVLLGPRRELPPALSRYAHYPVALGAPGLEIEVQP